MNQLNFLTQTQTAWCCAFWQRTTETMQKMWHCRSTLPCYSPSAATAALPSCASQDFRGSSSCWVLWMPTETRKRTETFTACWLRTPRLTTAGSKRWGTTARRVDALTSGCLNWSCRNAEGLTPACTNKHRNFLGSDELKDPLLLMQGWPGADWDGLS